VHPKIVSSLLCLVCSIPLWVGAETVTQTHPVDGVLGHWRTLQEQLTDYGVILETINTIDVLTPVSGGLRRNIATTGDLDLLLTIDVEKVLGLNESTFFVYGLGLYGENPSRNVGDVQAVSNIAAPSTWRLFEAWYQQNFFDERVSILMGFYDVTSEFDVIHSASELFLNASFGTGAEFAVSGRNGPSTFPITSLAIRGQAILNSAMAVRAVIADGVPGDPNDPEGTEVILKSQDGIFWGTEFSYYTFSERKASGGQTDPMSTGRFRLDFSRVGRAAPREYEGKYTLGVWGYTTEMADLSDLNSSGNPIRRDGTYGLYGFVEQKVYHEKEDWDQGLIFFARAGVADPRVNRFSQFYGGGLIYLGLIPGRPNDAIGFGAAAALNGRHFERAQQRKGIPTADAEVAFEGTYAIDFSPEILLQPNIQYVINPGANPSIPDALVLGIRLGLNFNWFNPLDP